MRYYGYILLVLFTVKLQAQQHKDSLFYREDQFYLDLNLLLQGNAIDDFQQNGFSRSLHLGFLRDIPINKKGNRSIGLGLGYGYQRLVNSLNIEKEERSFLFSVPERNRALRNIISYHQLQLPIEIRWRTSTSFNHDFWRVYLAYRFSYQFAGKYTPFFGRPFNIPNQINPFQHTLGLSFGYGSWNLRFAHEMVPLIDDKVTLDTGRSPRINPIHIGLIFYFL